MNELSAWAPANSSSTTIHTKTNNSMLFTSVAVASNFIFLFFTFFFLNPSYPTSFSHSHLAYVFFLCFHFSPYFLLQSEIILYTYSDHYYTSVFLNSLRWSPIVTHTGIPYTPKKNTRKYENMFSIYIVKEILKHKKRSEATEKLINVHLNCVQHEKKYDIAVILSILLITI